MSGHVDGPGRTRLRSGRPLGSIRTRMDGARQEPQSSGDGKGAGNMPAAGSRVSVPTWIQLVGLPLALVTGFLFASAASHAVLVFTIAVIISLLLNPIVRALVMAGVPRAFAVLMVFSLFATIIAVVAIAVVNTGVTQVQVLRSNLPGYIDRLDDKVVAGQQLLDRYDLGVDLQDEGRRFLAQLQEKSSEISSRVVRVGQDFVVSIAAALFNLILVIVVSVYMLLDAPRIGRTISALSPSGSNIDQLFRRLETALLRYVRGQVAASVVMGVSAAIGLWIMGVAGIWEAGSELALVFGLIVAITEFAPSIGPVLGSIPPILVAAYDGVGPALAVIIFFILLHQVEGHIVVPRLMGAAIAVHPLLVIFGILAGAQVLGVLGVLLALPLLAMAREVVMFTREHFVLANWAEGEGSSMPPGSAGEAVPGGADAGDAEPSSAQQPAGNVLEGAGQPGRWQRLGERLRRRPRG